MDILDQLKQERAKGNSPMSAKAQAAAEASEALQRAMESLYARLERLAKGLRDLDPDVRTGFDIDPVGRMENLRQSGYAVETYDPVAPRFAFTFDCIGRNALTYAAQSVEQKNVIREQLEGLGLVIHIDDMSTWRYIISIKPVVKVRLIFEPAPDGNEIRMTAHNLDGLGKKLYSLHPEVVRDDLCNEIGKLILRRENRFAEFAGNHVSDDIRRQLQDRINARKRSREEVARDLEAEAQAAQKGGRIAKLLRRGAGDGASPSKRAQAGAQQAPDLGREHDGFIAWNALDADGEAPVRGDASDAVTDVPGVSAAAPESPLPSYSWMITRDMQNEDTGASVGRHGPAGGRKRRYSSAELVNKGEKFRLLDRDGEVRFYGLILGEYQGVEPLVDFGIARECYLIQYLRGGEWVRVRPAD